MEKPKKFITLVCEGQEIKGEMWNVPVKVMAYQASEMDAYLDSLKVDRERIVNLIEDNIRYVKREEIDSLANAIMSAIGGGE